MENDVHLFFPTTTTTNNTKETCLKKIISLKISADLILFYFIAPCTCMESVDSILNVMCIICVSSLLSLSHQKYMEWELIFNRGVKSHTHTCTCTVNWMPSNTFLLSNQSKSNISVSSFSKSHTHTHKKTHYGFYCAIPISNVSWIWYFSIFNPAARDGIDKRDIMWMNLSQQLWLTQRLYCTAMNGIIINKIW